jgi:hypothetical protein
LRMLCLQAMVGYGLFDLTVCDHVDQQNEISVVRARQPKPIWEYHRPVRWQDESPGCAVSECVASSRRSRMLFQCCSSARQQLFYFLL